MKKIISMLIALSMMLTMLAACNNDPVVDDNPDDGQQNEEVQGNEQGNEEIVSDTLNLVVDGVSDYVIVRGENAYISEVTASTELQSYLKQISGVEIPIVTDATAPVEKEIVVGKTNRESDGEFDREELGDDGLVIKTNGQKLFLVGGEQRGTLYAVYTFLEEYLGCRFYASDFEKIPELKTISLDKIEENKQIPVFETRNPYMYDMYDHNLSAKLKINVSLGRGAIAEDLGGSLLWAGSHCHTLYYLAEMTGERVDNEPCLSDENVYQTVLKNVLALLDEKPTAKFVSVSQNDSYEDYVPCQCADCLAVYEKTGSYAGIYLTFVNRIAEAIKDEYPNVIVHTLAYQFTTKAPVGVVPAENVMVQLCSSGCRRHPLEECDRFAHKTLKLEGLSFADQLKDWAEICDYLAVWDYITNYDNYNVTFPNFDILRQNIKLFADNNVKDVLELGPYQSKGGEFGELRSYLVARLLWDPYMSEEEYNNYMTEFVMDYYGPGGTKILEYIDLAIGLTKDIHFPDNDLVDHMFAWSQAIEVNSSDSYPADLTADMIRDYENVDWSQYWNYYKDIPETPLIITEGKRLFAEALEMTENEEQKKRIDKTSLQVTFLESYYLEGKLYSGSNALGKIILNFYNANPDVFTSDEQKTFRLEIIKLARTQAYGNYEEFNRTLAEKCLNYEIYNISEGLRLSADSVSNYQNTPNKWDK